MHNVHVAWSGGTSARYSTLRDRRGDHRTRHGDQRSGGVVDQPVSAQPSTGRRGATHGREAVRPRTRSAAAAHRGGHRRPASCHPCARRATTLRRRRAPVSGQIQLNGSRRGRNLRDVPLVRAVPQPPEGHSPNDRCATRRDGRSCRPQPGPTRDRHRDRSRQSHRRTRVGAALRRRTGGDSGPQRTTSPPAVRSDRTSSPTRPI